MIQQRLYEWMKHPELLDRDSLYELRSLLARYPYFQTARLLYLKNLFLLHDITFGEELRRAALYIADRRMLFSLVKGNGILGGHWRNSKFRKMRLGWIVRFH